MDDEHPDEAPVDTAKREWTEEFGADLPSGSLAGSFITGAGTASSLPWVTFVYVIDEEVPPGALAPPTENEDPALAEMSARAWWDPRFLPGNVATRIEVQDADWTMIGRAGHHLEEAQRDVGRARESRKKVKVKQVKDEDVLVFGFDIDGTITEAVEQYREIARGLQALGHTVIVVTARTDAKDFLEQLGFDAYDELFIVDRDGVAEEKAAVLKKQDACFMFDNRLKSGPAIVEVCPVTMQFDNVAIDNENKHRRLPPHLARRQRHPGY